MKHAPEYYYAIRIGDPRRHNPYFMLGTGVMGRQVPELFATRKDANEILNGFDDKTCKKVIRVKLQSA